MYSLEKASESKASWGGASQVVLAVDVGEGDDFVDVGAGVKAALGELAVVVFSAGAQGVEAQQELGVAGFAALVEELLYVIGIFEVPVPLVAAGMSGNQIGPVIDAEPVGEEFEGEARGSVKGGNRVSIGVEHDAATVGDAHGACRTCVGWQRRQRFQMGSFFGKEIDGPFLCFAEAELDIDHAAVAKYHDEKGEPPACGSYLKGAGAAPVHLRAFPGSESQGKKGGLAHGAHQANVILQDAEAALIALLGLQALEDLGRAVGVALQPALDGGLEWV